MEQTRRQWWVGDDRQPSFPHSPHIQLCLFHHMTNIIYSMYIHRFQEQYNNLMMMMMMKIILAGWRGCVNSETESSRAMGGLSSSSSSCCRHRLLLLLSSLCWLMSIMSMSNALLAEEKESLREDVRRMFYHAYDNYMLHAFPHDELKPLSQTFTDSLGELGNLKQLEHLTYTYDGSALTLIESLSSLAIMGNNTEFKKAVLWLGENLSFDKDVRVNVFECNIRLLGGLISAHLLAKESPSSIMSGGYADQLLLLAEDLGQRLLPAFNTPTGIPYAWINLKHGVRVNETTETSTSGCGSLILEMGALTRLTGDPRFEVAALNALRRLWSMRSSLDLMGTTLDVATGQWIEHSSGIGAGVDSFYEYLVKAYILFGSEEYWQMFHRAYLATQQHFRHGPWYHEADMRTGRATHWQFTSLQAFWPAVQVSQLNCECNNNSCL
ncbi:hypothetical protein O6H91_16G000800 [Diphasiastrum complanatum]|uniref:Uncharacterized protein n=1 Tax=Diphasiastrum complanatum TaxID=34168 RepID=A0ACC2B934_DIPCM|nr:hypothetical protein O6H91_16G000800 [Diphasiastrum complanatum]